mmetsp:Transcript_156948/g.273217  ORF Transcript_156948/g.273217 Transcript_156948/m.273217 type:complete len:349 (-) Transcript_156948:928-1974(-)
MRWAWPSVACPIVSLKDDLVLARSDTTNSKAIIASCSSLEAASSARCSRIMASTRTTPPPALAPSPELLSGQGFVPSLETAGGTSVCASPTRGVSGPGVSAPSSPKNRSTPAPVSGVSVSGDFGDPVGVAGGRLPGLLSPAGARLLGLLSPALVGCNVALLPGLFSWTLVACRRGRAVKSRGRPTSTIRTRLAEIDAVAATPCTKALRSFVRASLSRPLVVSAATPAMSTENLVPAPIELTTWDAVFDGAATGTTVAILGAFSSGAIASESPKPSLLACLSASVGQMRQSLSCFGHGLAKPGWHGTAAWHAAGWHVQDVTCTQLKPGMLADHRLSTVDSATSTAQLST